MAYIPENDTYKYVRGNMKFKQSYRSTNGTLLFYPVDEQAEEFLSIFPNSRGVRKTLTEEQISFLSEIGVDINILKPTRSNYARNDD